VSGDSPGGSPQWTTDHGRPTTDNPLLSHVDHEDFLLGRRTPQESQNQNNSFKANWISRGSRALAT
jgi:hypothetical protein